MKLQKLVEASGNKESTNVQFMDYVNTISDPDSTSNPLSPESTKLLSKIGGDLIKRGFKFDYGWQNQQPSLQHELCYLVLPRLDFAEVDATSRLSFFLNEPVWTNLQICQGGLKDFVKIDMSKLMGAIQEAHVAHAKIKALTDL